MTTSFSFVSYTGNGTTQTFNVPFQYISKSHVEVYIDGLLRTTGVSWDNDSTIRLSPAPASGSAVRIERNTPKTTAVVDFQDAGVLTESALDLNTKQGLYIVQEAFDEASNVVSQAVAAAVAATQVAGRSVPTVSPSLVGRLLVGRAGDSYGWAPGLEFNEATNVLSAQGFSGNLTGNVTGNLTGNVTGNLTGNVTGNVSGTATNVTGTVALANGGTGATTQAGARTALGLGSAATLNASATGSALVQAVDQEAARTVIGAAADTDNRWVPIASANITAANVINVTWTGGAYLEYKILVLGARPASATANDMLLLVRRNGSFLSGASDYNGQHVWWNGVTGNASAGPAPYHPLTGNGIAAEASRCEIALMQSANTERILVDSRCRYTSNTPAQSSGLFSSNIVNGSGWLDGARIQFVGGATNFAAIGRVVVLGLRS